MKRFLAAVVAAAIAFAVVLASAVAGVSYVVPYVDSAGDSGGEVDVTLVSVDIDALGRITFAVTVTGFDPGSWDGRMRNIQVYLDTDMNRSTGSAGGSELMFMADAGPQDLVLHVGHPNATGRFPFEPMPPTISFSRNGNVLTWVFDKADVGITDGFDFLLYTQIPDVAGGAAHIADHAPDGVGRFWRYSILPEPVAQVQPVTVSPVFGSVLTVPARAAAGKKLAFTLAVRRSDTGAPLTTGTMTCDPSVAGVVLKHTESFAGGIARVSVVVPKTAKGKLLTVKVKITSGGQSATKTVTYKVI